jgi:hypothetical protein
MTWSTPNESVPGRTAQFLVRDEAGDNHPIIGIFALSSAAVRLAARDQFLGWDSETFLSTVVENPTTAVAKWAFNVVESALAEIHKTDLIKDKVYVLTNNTQDQAEVINNLRAEAEACRLAHKRAGQSKTPPASCDSDWQKAAETPLFRSKRAEQLAKLLEIKLGLAEFMDDGPTRSGLSNMLSAQKGRKLLSDIVTIARSKTVGTGIADLTVCGAVAPYRHLAGGKLVSMLAVSPKVVAMYNDRYRSAVSVIASSMAGREIIRDSQLVYVGTTSLYGQRPNQYDRIQIPIAKFSQNSSGALRYKHLKKTSSAGEVSANTKGVGSFHFSRDTVSRLEDHHSRTRGVWHANRVFGEGTSPKLRGIRDGLASLGLESDSLINHGISRCVYGVSLASNAREFLLGIQKKPRYLLPLSSKAKSDTIIGSHWLDRWASTRFARQDIKDLIARETLVYPIVHSARVPSLTDEGQIDMF